MLNAAPKTTFVQGGREVTLTGYAPDDLIYSSIKNEGRFYETDLLEYMQAVLGTAECVVDIGANIGNHSVFLGTFVADLVVAIEANPAILPVLESNLHTNDIRHIICPVGVGAGNGCASIVLPNEHGSNIGAARLSFTTPKDASRITVVSLDTLLKDISDQLGNRRIDALKIDVEGMEPQVLLGATELLRRFSPELFVETMDHCKFREVAAILWPMGYIPVTFHAATPVWHFTPVRDLFPRRALRILGHFAGVTTSRILKRILRRIGRI